VRSGPTAESAPRDRGGSPVIVLSLVLVIAAAVLLVLGIFFQDGLLLIYLSIGSCLLAMALLGAGVLLRRRETAAGVANGGAATASATAGTASVGNTAVRGNSVEGPRVLPDDGPDRDETVEVWPVERAVVREPAATDAPAAGVDPAEVEAEPAAGSSDHRTAATHQVAAAPVASATAGAVRPPAKRAVVKKAVVRKQTSAPAAEPSASTSGVSDTPVVPGAAKKATKKATAKKATAKKATARKATVRKAPASAAPVKRATTTKATPAATSTSTGRGLDAVKGLGPAKRQALLDRFGSEEAVRAASVDELTQVRGVGPGLARSIKEALG
jgi:DNA uptake protein ComE-like DNA-binding protein